MRASRSARCSTSSACIGRSSGSIDDFARCSERVVTEVERQVRAGFPFLPAGCHLELDSVARDIVLRSIRDAIPSGWRERQAELRTLGDVSLAEYLKHTGLELEDVYAGNHSWTELRRSAGLSTEPAGSDEVSILRAIGRLLHVDDDERVAAYIRLVRSPEPPNLAELELRDQRWLRMLVASLTTLGPRQPFSDAVEQLWAHPQVRAELEEMFGLLRGRADHLHEPIGLGAAIPLSVHARYTRNEIWPRLDPETGRSQQRGKQASTGTQRRSPISLRSPWTRVSVGFRQQPGTGTMRSARRSSIGRANLQRRWRARQASGTSVISSAQTNVVLFARLRRDDRAFWCLGRASYVSHEGDRPIAFRWRLASPLPGDLYSAFAAAVA